MSEKAMMTSRVIVRIGRDTNGDVCVAAITTNELDAASISFDERWAGENSGAEIGYRDVLIDLHHAVPVGVNDDDSAHLSLTAPDDAPPATLAPA